MLGFAYTSREESDKVKQAEGLKLAFLSIYTTTLHSMSHNYEWQENGTANHVQRVSHLSHYTYEPMRICLVRVFVQHPMLNSAAHLV